jgi:hypothetical protein
MQLEVNDIWIRLVHKAVCEYLKNWSGGDPLEQMYYMELKTDLDRLVLELAFQEDA